MIGPIPSVLGPIRFMVCESQGPIRQSIIGIGIGIASRGIGIGIGIARWN